MSQKRRSTAADGAGVESGSVPATTPMAPPPATTRGAATAGAPALPGPSAVIRVGCATTAAKPIGRPPLSWRAKAPLGALLPYLPVADRVGTGGGQSRCPRLRAGLRT